MAKKKNNVGSSGENSTKNSENPQIKKGDDEPTVDMKSVINLGYGPISAAELDRLVSSGQVIEYEENGKLKYKRATPLKSNSASFGFNKK